MRHGYILRGAARTYASGVLSPSQRAVFLFFFFLFFRAGPSTGAKARRFCFRQLERPARLTDCHPTIPASLGKKKEGGPRPPPSPFLAHSRSRDANEFTEARNRSA